ncbi:DUF6044 family protein, partial [Bacillus spizizenii]|uniref:DUF6044 family protein n=1 Tax=Bacillus spizizenii TaxID=96241 RepID=UPI001F614BC0
SIAFMTSIYLFVEYRLVFSMLFSHAQLHRIEFISSRHDVCHSLRLYVKNFVFGHNHVMTVHTVVILPILLLVFAAVLFKLNRTKLEYVYLFLCVLNYGLSL